MRDGLRHALLVVAGLLAVLLIISFTAYGLTTYGSIRHIIGEMAAQPDKAASLQDQYEDMAIYFASGVGDTYTFRFNAAPVAVSKSQAAGLGQVAVISLVLDTYTSDLYNNRLITGSPGFAGSFFNATGNLVYLLITLAIAIAFAGFTAGAILPFQEKPLSDRLKSAGKVIAIICVLAFLFFSLMPGLIISFVWGSIANTDAVRDVLDIIEPAVTSTLLRTAIIMIILGIAVFGAGYYVETKDGGPVAHGTSYTAKRPVTPIRHPENNKRKGL